MKGCSFTGHRRINPEHYSRLPDLIFRGISYAYEKGVRDFYSGGAVGFDTLAAREVIKFRITHPDIRLIMLLPCLDQDLKWSERQRSDYHYVLSAADEIVYTSEEYTDTCLRERNVRLAELGDVLICYLSYRNSGAGQTVAMAKKMNKEVYNLYYALETYK